MKLVWSFTLLLSSIALSAVCQESATENSYENTETANIESETEHYQVLLAKSAVAEQGDYAEKETKPLPKKDICLTRHCVSAAHRLFDYMNEKADPCEDFNEFACGSFMQNQIIPDDESRIGIFDIIQTNVEQRGRLLLESPPDDKFDFESYKMAKRYYKSCMDQDTLDKLGNQPALDVLKSLGGWPLLEDQWDSTHFDVWDQGLKMYKLGFSSDTIASSYIHVDAKNTSARVIYFDQASLGLDKEYLDKGFDDPVVKAYHRYMVDTAVYLGADELEASEEMKKALEFEMRLANISAPKAERRNTSLLYNPTTLGELTTGPNLPASWTKYVQDILTFGDSKVDVDASEKIIVSDLQFYANLSKVLAEFDDRTKANYMAWRVAGSSMTYLDKKARDIKQKYAKAKTGQEVASVDWKRCGSSVGFNSLGSSNFVFAVSSMYARKYFPQNDKKDVVEMTRYLRQAFEQIVENIDWMDAATKQEARAKLDKMGQHIAYPDEFLDKNKVDEVFDNLFISETDFLGNAIRITKHFYAYYAKQLREPVDPNDWREHKLVAVVNAFYNPALNNFEFPAGILQGTFYDSRVPKYLNFGGIGFIIGHEITHGFDDQGRQRNAKGELVDWWKPETNEKFREKAQCVIWQYGNYTVKQINQNVNGVNTQGENIADNGGLKEAYLAYENWERENGIEPGLPGHPYSSKQLFWIAYAQNWCTKYRDEKLRSQVLTGYHSPGEFRIVGPLSNNPDFANDFNCPVGSKMNPEKKCFVW